MAVMSLSTRMVFWKIKINNTDVTDVIRSFVNSIRIKDTVMPVPEKSKEEHTPSEATISITSNNYIEDLFIEGLKIEIYMGYDRIIQPLVFSGTIMQLPDGSAKDMLDYTVKAYSEEVRSSLMQKNRTFVIATKPNIVAQIASEQGWTPYISIKDVAPIKAEAMPIQSAMTDLEFLYMCAKKWSCLCWFDVSNSTLYFVDAETAFKSGNIYRKTGIYSLGYRTDIVKCNVESVAWQHNSARASEGADGGIAGFNELGTTVGNKQGKIIALGKTWELKPEYIKEATKGGFSFAKYSAIAAGLTATGNGYVALKKYYRVVSYNDGSHKDTAIDGAGSGFDITIRLNEGDPYIKPPFECNLYSGVINPKANCADLPNWLVRNRIHKTNAALLNCVETNLIYDNGLLQSELKCVMDTV